MKVHKLFQENKTVKGMEVDIQLEPDAKLLQHKRLSGTNTPKTSGR